MSARALLERLTADGVRVRLDGDDVRLAVEPPRVIDRALIDEIRTAKAEVVAELRRLADASAGEWRVVGCSRFVALANCDEALESRAGACLACGASIELHGSPAVSEWRRVVSLDDVCLVQIRLVIASAAAIVREARR